MTGREVSRGYALHHIGVVDSKTGIYFTRNAYFTCGGVKWGVNA